MPQPLPREVLVVDDDALQRAVMRGLLRSAGVETVTEAADGTEALRIVAERPEPFGLVLLDLSMPGRDGIELLRDLGERQYEGPIVLVSGFEARVRETARQHASTHGLRVVGTIEKPIAIDALEALMGRSRRPSPRARPAVEAATAQELTVALERQEISVDFQPKVPLGGGRVQAAECLARWRRPGRPPVPPDEFVALAEESGQIDALLRAVLGRAAAQCAAWRRDGFDTRLAVNVSMDNLGDLGIPDVLVTLVRDAGLSPEDFTLEVTESRFARDQRSVHDVLLRLRLAGFSLSIDDFGTGFSSLAQLRRIPFSELKIDRAFVTGAHADPDRIAIIRASVHMARQLGMATVAEGVETAEDVDLVRRLGCDSAQGYFFSKPLDPEAFASWALSRGDDAGARP